ncbi:MAG: DUF1365 family protein [Candidatus Paceibacteria bacterium]|jgi:DUF1365 family protein
MRSTLYSGYVRHERLVPRPHSFRNGVQLAYLDLEEIPQLFRSRWLWSTERRNLVSFRRADYLGSPKQPLREAVLERVEEKLGRRPSGNVGLLTQLRMWGYLFNPVSFYFCHDEGGELDAIVAEITNTPWGERHAYVLDARGGREGKDRNRIRLSFKKEFHVSPFFDLDQVYEWRFSAPGEHLQVSMTNVENGRPVFHAELACERKPMTGKNMATVLLRYPFQPLRLHLAIYWQAARLYLKRTPFFTHPKKRLPVQDASIS